MICGYYIYIYKHSHQYYIDSYGTISGQFWTICRLIPIKLSWNDKDFPPVMTAAFKKSMPFQPIFGQGSFGLGSDLAKFIIKNAIRGLPGAAPDGRKVSL